MLLQQTLNTFQECYYIYLSSILLSSLHLKQTYDLVNHQYDHSAKFEPRKGRTVLNSFISNMQPLPPLLALPVELKMQIFAHLSHRKYGELWLTILRRTHPLLRCLISPRIRPIARPRGSHSVAASSRYCRRMDLRIQLLWVTESEHPYLFPPGFHPCFNCGEVVDSSHLDTYRYTATPNAVSSHRLRYDGSRCYENPYFSCIMPGRRKGLSH